uniref:Uncharacterized protein n=1 Tax=uncultured marine group II/III euryarchaeote KM3_194_G04 TaxID=1457969 RepID=A0A075GWL1_9EURY|nr:hypothetical protein [uncultured marine group II/III euryarchaeote KM3_194_G04]
MADTNEMAYAIKQNEIDYDTTDLVMMQAQLLNRDANGRIMVEKLSSDYPTAAAGKYYIPGVSMKFGEHPEEAGHRILTEELEIEDRELRLAGTQSHWNDEKNHWYLLYLFETAMPLSAAEMANPCEGIEQLLYIDLEDASDENATHGLLDIREAMHNPGRTYV